MLQQAVLGPEKRMDYMISELKACQEAGEINNSDWGKGYIGGVPKSKFPWSTLQKGDFAAYRSAWVPWYNVHKLYAGSNICIPEMKRPKSFF